MFALFMVGHDYPPSTFVLSKRVIVKMTRCVGGSWYMIVGVFQMVTDRERQASIPPSFYLVFD